MQRECVSDVDGRNYVGRQNVTFSGRRCLSWNSQEYVVHPYDDVSYFPDSSVDSYQTGAAEVLLEDVSNFCRNPTFDGTYDIWPWCYGDGAKHQKEYCPIPFCEGIVYLSIIHVSALHILCDVKCICNVYATIHVYARIMIIIHNADCFRRTFTSIFR